MLKPLLIKLKESLISVLPLTLLIIILSFTPLVDLTAYETWVFILCSVFLILGISLFNLGADQAMQPIGKQIGSTLTKTKNPYIILIVCFILGVLITIAEPDLTILANQVKDAISPSLLIFTIGIGVGLFLVLAVLKIILKVDLTSILILFYMIVFAFVSLLIENGHSELLPLAFDSGGVTTGPITVPFIMALGVGIAKSIGGNNSSENSFGLIALCSVGPILSLIILGLFTKGDITYQLGDYSISENLGRSLLSALLETMKDVSIALSLIVIFFLVIQFVYLHLPRRRLIHIGIGIICTFFGLVIFLTGVKIGFLPIGYKIGTQLASYNKYLVVIFAFIIGLVVVLAEPAIHVLTKQVDDLTNGQVSRKSLLIALSVGMSISLGLSIIRIIFSFSILYYLIPGYLISIALSFFIPKIYTAIAFDSGGVSSGPLTSSFILPFAIGVCWVVHDQSATNILTDAFGIVSLVALTPLISIQSLGFKSILTKRIRSKVRLKKMLGSSDEQIIDFNWGGLWVK